MFLIKICHTVSVHFFSDLHEGLPSSKSSLHSRFQREYLVATLAGPPVKNYQLQKQPLALQREQLTLQKKNLYIFLYPQISWKSHLFILLLLLFLSSQLGQREEQTTQKGEFCKVVCLMYNCINAWNFVVQCCGSAVPTSLLTPMKADPCIRIRKFTSLALNADR